MTAAGHGDEKSLVTAKDRHFHSSSKDHPIYLKLAAYFFCPFSLSYFVSVRGAENFHVYLWLAKDMCWALSLMYPAMIFGALAMAWCLVLFANAADERNSEDAFFIIPMFLWLFGNYWWMTGEVVNNDDDGTDSHNRVQASYIMMAGIGVFLLYHIALRPLELLSGNAKVEKFYSDAGVMCRFSYFKSWRQYEHMHTLFWLAKDLSWCVGNKITWIIFLLPTIFVAGDFIWESTKSKRMTVDGVHYVVTLCWVIANMSWAIGELWEIGPDEAVSLWTRDHEALHTARWYTAWILLCCFIPFVLLYGIWVPVTNMGVIVDVEAEDREKLDLNFDGNVRSSLDNL